MKLSNHTQFYNFLSLDLFTYLMLKEFIFQCLFTRICTSSFKERLVILWKNQSTCYHWKVKDKNKSNISRWQFIGKTSKATPMLHHVALLHWLLHNVCVQFTKCFKRAFRKTQGKPCSLNRTWKKKKLEQKNNCYWKIIDQQGL